MPADVQADLKALESIFAKIGPKERAEALKPIADVLAQKWIPQPGPQTDAFFSEADELFYGGSAGGGKALCADEKVVTPFGFRRIGDLKVGDTVCAADGTPTKVIGVFSQGVRPLYRVRFQDGASALADADHRWNYSIAGHKWGKSGREWKVGTTAQLVDFMASGRRVQIPLCLPLKFTKAYKTPQRSVIDPYVLGLLLGDGYTKQAGPGSKWSFATEDRELLEALPGDWVFDRGCSYRLRGPVRKTLQAEFERLGLTGCGSNTKFVPEVYRWASVGERVALLQGLMDTDGTIDDRGHASFTSTSEQLAKDVAWLVCSLGGRARITTKKTTGLLAYNVYIRVEDSTELFRLRRKRAAGTKYQHGKPKRRIESVEYEKDGLAVCIAVDHPEALYVVGEGCVVTHNTDLLLGTAIRNHRYSLVLRRVNKEVRGLERRLQEILGTRDGYNSQTGEWKLSAGGVIQLGGCQYEEDKFGYQGVPHDLKAWDEISNFTESQFRFINTWNRSADEKQRCRVIAAGNPPITPEGLWVIKYWGPWLDPQHPNPAKPGELRWFTSIDGQDQEVEGPTPIWDGERYVHPRSRTFIPGSLDDNIFLAETGYQGVLDSLPPDLRSAMRDGNFTAGIQDDEWQVIPTQWVREAQERWREDGNRDVMMTSVGVDPNGSGKDKPNGKDITVVAPRYGAWYARPIRRTASELPEATDVAALIMANVRNGAGIVIDVGGGYGIAPASFLKENGANVKKFDGTQPSNVRALGFEFEFLNLRAEAWWRFREALDPAQDGGSPVALPPDQKIMADLCAPRYQIERGRIRIEKKEDLKKRLGRSPDDGDAIVMAWSEGDKLAHRRMSRATFAGSGGRPKVNAGHERMKRRGH